MGWGGVKRVLEAEKLREREIVEEERAQQGNREAEGSKRSREQGWGKQSFL